MRLQKTDRARAELKPGVRTLGQRERTLLLLADGSKSVSDFRRLFAGDGEQIALQLLKDGFLEAHPASSKTTSFVPTRPAPLTADTPRPVVATTARQREDFPSPETTQAIQVSADSFEGKRSLATTRMFLFDMCERMFARRNPTQAEAFREGLRNAKDRESMLAVSREMMVQIEAVAGHERADSIAERIAMLLPAE
ncbi:MAG: hypothetical protein ACKVOT_06120 [Polaromonas sp.]